LLRYRHLGTDRLPMHGRSVVVLHRVLEIYLPVAGEIVFPTPHADHVGHVVGPKPLRKITQILAQAWDARIETDENEPIPSLEPETMEAIGLLVEVEGLLHRRGADEVTVKGIGPAVVRAGNDPAIALAVEEAGAAVTAAIGEGADLVIAVPYDDHGIA